MPDPSDLDDDVRALLGLFLEARRKDLESLDAALAAGDFPAIRAVGHSFKGSCAPFGFAEAGRIGAALEEAAGRSDRVAVDALAARLRASIPAGPEPAP